MIHGSVQAEPWCRGRPLGRCIDSLLLTFLKADLRDWPVWVDSGDVPISGLTHGVNRAGRDVLSRSPDAVTFNLEPSVWKPQEPSV